jgi:3D (Asp-Asp-Asp) domain-containing protein
MTTAVAAAVTGAFLLQALTPIASALVEESVREAPVQPTYPTYSVSMTAYNAVEEQTDSTPTQTSIGAYTNPDIIAARSKDLAEALPYGTVIEIVPVSTSTPIDHKCGRELVHEQIGYRVIADAMHPRMKNKIDILMDHTKPISIRGKKMNPARIFGVCKNVEIRVVGKIDTKKMPKTQEELALALTQTPDMRASELAIR